MATKNISINVFAPVVWTLMVYAASTSRISWWVVILIILNDVKLNWTLYR